MRCDQLRPRLAALHHGELDPRDVSAAQAHLADCAACRGELRDIERVDGLLGGWSADPGAADVWPAVQARLPKRRSMWKTATGLAAAAALVGAVTLAVVRTRSATPHPGPGPVGLYNNVAPFTDPADERALKRHVDLASTMPPKGVMYAYIGTYDEALDAGNYEKWSDVVTASGPPAVIDPSASLLIAPGYLPRGSSAVRAEPTIATAEAAWRTPFGELSVFQSMNGGGRAGIQTIVKDGREFKLARFEKNGVEITLTGEGLPWPEMDRVKRGFESPK